MNGKGLAGLRSLCAALACLGLAWLGVGLAEDTTARTEAPVKEESNTTAADRAAKPLSAAESARQSCVRQCEIDNGYCNSEVRQARQ